MMDLKASDAQSKAKSDTQTFKIAEDNAPKNYGVTTRHVEEIKTKEDMQKDDMESIQQEGEFQEDDEYMRQMGINPEMLNNPIDEHDTSLASDAEEAMNNYGEENIPDDFDQNQDIESEIQDGTQKIYLGLNKEKERHWEEMLFNAQEKNLFAGAFTLQDEKYAIA